LGFLDAMRKDKRQLNGCKLQFIVVKTDNWTQQFIVRHVVTLNVYGAHVIVDEETSVGDATSDTNNVRCYSQHSRRCPQTRNAIDDMPLLIR
jgi:hypothetical protein